MYVSSGVDDALGENIIKLPMLLALAEQFPGARIAWVARQPAASCFSRTIWRRWSAAAFTSSSPTCRSGRALGRPARTPPDPGAAFRSRDLIPSAISVAPCLAPDSASPLRQRTWRYALSDRRPPRGVSWRPPRLVD
ncbi:MAG: hypothetical protein WDO24_22205 [Pseudomonadota bacterium]